MIATNAYWLDVYLCSTFTGLSTDQLRQVNADYNLPDFSVGSPPHHSTDRLSTSQDATQDDTDEQGAMDSRQSAGTAPGDTQLKSDSGSVDFSDFVIKQELSDSVGADNDDFSFVEDSFGNQPPYQTAGNVPGGTDAQVWYTYILYPWYLIETELRTWVVKS